MDSFFGIGLFELVMIAVVALVVLGPERLPGAMREVAKWMRQLRNLSSEFQSQFSEEFKMLDEMNPRRIINEVIDPNATSAARSAASQPAKPAAAKPVTPPAARPPAAKPAAPAAAKPLSAAPTAVPAASVVTGDETQNSILPPARAAGENDPAAPVPPPPAAPGAEVGPDRPLTPPVDDSAADAPAPGTAL